jgi:hypothetical protein
LVHQLVIQWAVDDQEPDEPTFHAREGVVHKRIAPRSVNLEVDDRRTPGGTDTVWTPVSWDSILVGAAAWALISLDQFVESNLL